MVVQDLEPRRVEAMDASHQRARHRAIADDAGAAFEREPVGDAARDLEIAQGNAAALPQADEPGRLADVERLVSAVEHEAFECDAVAFASKEGRAADELEEGCARRADDPRARAELELPYAEAAGREQQRRAAAGGVVDGGLQGHGLVLCRAGLQAKLRGRRHLRGGETVAVRPRAGIGCGCRSR